LIAIDFIFNFFHQCAVNSYELSKLGFAASDADFKAALSSFAGRDDTFTAFAKSFNHIDAQKITSNLRSDKTVREIAMSCDGVRQLHALCVRVFQYPEGIVAVWVMVAGCAQKGFKNTKITI
jgi:hypothetical protein